MRLICKLFINCINANKLITFKPKSEYAHNYSTLNKFE